MIYEIIITTIISIILISLTLLLCYVSYSIYKENKKIENKDTKDSSKEIDIILQSDDIVNKVNKLIDDLIENASNIYTILTIDSSDDGKYINSTASDLMAEYIFQTIKKNMTFSIFNTIKLVYVINDEKDLDNLLKLRIKLFMINIIINNNIEK